MSALDSELMRTVLAECRSEYPLVRRALDVRTRHYKSLQRTIREMEKLLPEVEVPK